VARIPPDVIDRVRDSADILDVVNQYVDLKRRGRNYFGLCPFHQEKTPSFSVAPDKGIYHCFGCGAGGNAINFIMEHEKLSFVESVKSLGERYGIEVNFEEGTGSSEFFSGMYEIHEKAADLFHGILFSERGSAALSYLKERGLSEDSIKLFRVGFAPESDNVLLNTCRGVYSDEVLEKSGLFNKGQTGFFDRFRSRIMFPISNPSGKVIAFGGRIFSSNDPAKYLNSPETPLYKKSDTLYGMDKTKSEIRDNRHAILVEGYTDLLQIYQSGIKNVVAVSGTALTQNHVNQLGKFTKKVSVVYDGDEAGIRAAVRAGYILLRGTVEPAMVSVPADTDPDDWVRNNGPEPLTAAIENAKPLLKFHLESVSMDAMSSAERSELIRDILREISGIKDPVIRDDFLKSLASSAGLDDVEVIRMFKSQSKRKRSSEPETGPEPDLFTTVEARAQAEIVRILASQDSRFLEQYSSKVDTEYFTDPLLKKIIGFILDKKDELTIPEILGRLEEKEEREKVSALFMEDYDLSDSEQALMECIKSLKTQKLKDRIKAARLALRDLEAAGGDGSEQVNEIASLQKELEAIE